MLNNFPKIPKTGGKYYNMEIESKGNLNPCMQKFTGLMNSSAMYESPDFNQRIHLVNCMKLKTGI